MRRRWIALTFVLLLAGCGSKGGRKDEFPYTPFPYRGDDEFYETLFKSLGNVPVWTLEFTVVLAFLAAYLWLQSGAPTSFRH